MKKLRTANQVIERLGGLDRVAELTLTEKKSAYNWPRFGTFPSSTYKAMTDALKRRGYTAPGSLWKQREGKRAA
jgi:hypothetical protein